MKLVHLVGFIIKKFVTMHGHMNEEKARCPCYVQVNTVSSIENVS